MLIIVVLAVSCVVVRGWKEEVGKWVGLGVEGMFVTDIDVNKFRDPI